MQKMWVVAQRASGSTLLVSETDPSKSDPAALEVIQYIPERKAGWRPHSLQSYLARGYWLDPQQETIDVTIETWLDDQLPAGKSPARRR